AKNIVKHSDEGEKDLEKKEYISSPIKVKINAEDDFTSSFLKLLEVASIAYVSLFDTHYRANEMKVQNLLDIYAIKRDLVISTRIPKNIEKGKYPDAYIFSPKKGIENEKPVKGLDFASLYPSIIMAYNLSPEKFIFNSNDANITQITCIRL
ncbi:1535_t:CDS:2, partial [Funneliformis geosporum]